jgi:hypothetical protein
VREIYDQQNAFEDGEHKPMFNDGPYQLPSFNDAVCGELSNAGSLSIEVNAGLIKSKAVDRSTLAGEDALVKGVDIFRLNIGQSHCWIAPDLGSRKRIPCPNFGTEGFLLVAVLEMDFESYVCSPVRVSLNQVSGRVM